MSQECRFAFVLGLSLAAVVVGAPGAGVTARADDEPKQTLITAAATAPASPPTVAQPEKYKLAFKFRRNQVVHQEISHEFQLTTNKNQDTETARNSSKSRRHYRVMAVDDKTGVADLELTIDWVHMLASFDKGDGSPVEPIEFQSDDPQKHPKQFNDILASIGRHARLCFGSNGAPVKTVPGAPKRTEPAVTGSTDGTLEAHLFPLPEHAVAIGESWKERFDVRVMDEFKNLVRISLQRTYKLRDVKDGRAMIDYRTVILTPMNNPAVAAQFIEREITGKIEFDVEQGLIVSREWSVDKTIIGAVGANSSMRATSHYREKLLGSEATPDRPGKDGSGKDGPGKDGPGKIVPASTNQK